MDQEGREIRYQFFQALYKLLRKEKQAFKDLAVYNKHTDSYCFCIEGLIALALEGEVVTTVHGFTQIKVPRETTNASDTVQYICYDTILPSGVYRRFLPSVIEVEFLLSHRDKLELSEAQIKCLPERPSLDWWELNDKIQLNFIQFKILLREVYKVYQPELLINK